MRRGLREWVGSAVTLAWPYSGLRHPKADAWEMGLENGVVFRKEESDLVLWARDLELEYPRGGEGSRSPDPPQPLPGGGYFHPIHFARCPLECILSAFPHRLEVSHHSRKSGSGPDSDLRAQGGLWRSFWKKGPWLGLESSRKWGTYARTLQE